MIDVRMLQIDTTKNQDKIDYKIIFYLVLGKKFKWLKLEINKGKLQTEKTKKILDNFLNSEKIKKNSLNKNKKIIFDIIKSIKIKLEKLQINGEIGLSHIIVLSYLVAVINIILSFVFLKSLVKTQSKDSFYRINPNQTTKSYLKLSINCIISIKIANIINTIIKKRSEEINERTSYRKFNGNCNAKYPRYGWCKHNNWCTNGN